MLHLKSTSALAGLAGLALAFAAAPAGAQTMDELIAGATAEGMLTTIALPHDWCGYGDVIAGFKAKYPFLTVNELNPDAGLGRRARGDPRQQGQHRPAGART